MYNVYTCTCIILAYTHVHVLYIVGYIVCASHLCTCTCTCVLYEVHVHCILLVWACIYSMHLNCQRLQHYEWRTCVATLTRERNFSLMVCARWLSMSVLLVRSSLHTHTHTHIYKGHYRADMYTVHIQFKNWSKPSSCALAQN